MNPSLYFIAFLPLLIVLYEEHERKKFMLKRLMKSKMKEGSGEMLELAKKFLGKECIIYTFNSQVVGVIKEFSDGAILIENKNIPEVINLDFIVRIREYPRGKNSNKKSPTLD